MSRVLLVRPRRGTIGRPIPRSTLMPPHFVVLFYRLIGHIARRVGILTFARDKTTTDPALLTPPDSPTTADCAPEDPSPSLPTVEEFLRILVSDSNVPLPTLLVSLVYLDRISKRMSYYRARGPSTALRLVLASLICAAKYLNDSSPKLRHWVSPSCI